MTVLGRPISDWTARLINALAVSGYPTVNLRSEPGPQAVSVQQLIAVASTAFEGGALPWTNVGDHLQALVPLGAETVSLQTHRRKIDIYVGRTEPGFNIQTALEYMTGMEFWLRRLAELLPKVSISGQQKAAIETLSTAAAGVIPGADVALRKLLTAIAEAEGPGSCVTIHAYSQVSDAFRQEWSETDFTSEPFRGIGNRHWLWEIDTKVVTEGGRHPSRDNLFHTPSLTAGEFKSLVEAVTG